MPEYNLLNDFIDGELTTEKETEFFAKLASSTELQIRFKQIMAFRESLRNNKELFVPLQQSTQAIYSAIGLKQADALDNSYQIESENKNILPKRNYSILKWSLISSLLTAITVYLLMLNYSSDNSINIIKSGVEKTSNNGLQESQSKMSSMTLQSKNSSALQTENSKLNKNRFKHNQTILSEFEVNGATISGIIENSSIQNESSFDNTLAEFQENLNLFNYSTDKNSDYEPLIDKKSDLKISLFDLKFELRGTQYWNVPEATISPSRIAKFNNNSVAVFYNFNENFSFGLDIRAENFFQRFSGVDDMGVENIYEQQPNFTTFGIGLRYYYPMASNIFPLAQLNAGGNNAGQVYRAMLGVEYRMLDIVGFIVGFEYSAMIYHHQLQNFISNKFGFIYGVSVNMK